MVKKKTTNLSQRLAESITDEPSMMASIIVSAIVQGIVLTRRHPLYAAALSQSYREMTPDGWENLIKSVDELVVNVPALR